MPHETTLISTIVIGLVLAFILGAIANRLRISPLVGYLLAGVVAGPFTPGFVADQTLAPQLAEIGVVLLMFGVGMHFSPKELLSVKAIAIPGALVQITVATLLGMVLGWSLGWPLSAGIVFGVALSTASTVVLLREMQERRLLETMRGRIAVGWLIVEDIAMVLALVLLPAFAHLGKTQAAAGGAGFDVQALILTMGFTIGKVVAFIAVMMLAGRRVVPWVLHRIAHTGSRELFRLAVLSISLGIAFGASALFDVSFALGAFFAGMILSESELSQRAAEETLPLRDAFAVLFFVSVGMLFDPSILVRDPWPVVATVAIIIFGKSLAAFAIVLAFRHPMSTALTISASLAQIGEFSFIIAALGLHLELLPQRANDLILAGALLSICANPLIFALAARAGPRLGRWKGSAAEPVAEPEEDKETLLIPTRLNKHAIIVGYGRVGSLIAERLLLEGRPLLVVEERRDLVDKARGAGIEVISGNAAQPGVLAAANLEGAQTLVVAIPHAFEAGQIVAQARSSNTELEIVARAHFDAEVELLRQHGASFIVMGEREIARGMLERILLSRPAASAA